MPPIVGLASEATKNRIQPKSGIPTFVCCGADILLTGLFQDVEGNARCPVCDGTIRLNVVGKAVKTLEPSDALLHYVRCDVGNDPGKFGVMCDSTFLFDRVECLDAWKAAYKGPVGKVATPYEFLAEVLATRRG